MIVIKEFCCKDCGLDCAFQVTGISQGQVIQKIIHHMHEEHGMKVIPADFMIKIKHSINDQNFLDTVNPTANEPLVAK